MEDRIKNNSIPEEEIETEAAEQMPVEEHYEEPAEAPAAEEQQAGYNHHKQVQQDEYYGDPAQYGYDPRFAQQGYAQQYGYYNNQYNDPYYPQNMDPRYAQQYNEQYYQQNMDPRYAQQNMDPRYAQQYYQQNMDPRYAQQYYGQPGQGYPGYGPYGPQGEDPAYANNPYYAPAGGRRRQDYAAGRYDESRGRDEEAEYDQPYDDDYDGDDYEEDYEEEYEEKPRKKKRSGFSKMVRSFKRKLSRVPTRTLLLIGGGIVLLLIAIILLVVLLPKNPGSQEVVVATSPTPVATDAPEEQTPEPTQAPTPTPHPLATPLEFGMTGDIVAEIQQRLIDLGYMNYPVVDGVQQVTTVYGKTTKNAIRTFQSKNGLDTDGNCGPLTYDALMSDSAKAFYIERNDEGEAVKKLQEALISLGYLKASATGHCGQSTVDAIKAFQTANQLEADGKAGQTTLQLLYSGNAISANAAAAAAATAAPAATDAAVATPAP
ncbi:MAG: peptidoglycan-binding protein [Clostridia bacterium]|nr:peptidoglycan-binding protein [Clostridia bacterium]